MTKILNTSNFKEIRRELRKHSTQEEYLLWNQLRNSKLGVKFRRQYSAGGYVFDFFCPKKKLAVEIDGPIHLQSKEYDKLRDKLSQELGFTTLRFTNEEVEKHMNNVLQKIRSYA